MANVLSKSNIADSNTIEAWQVSQSVDAFTGIAAYDITISGSLIVTGSTNLSGSTTIVGGDLTTRGFSNATSSWATNVVNTPTSIVGQYTVIGNPTAIAGNLNINAGYAVIPSGSTTVTLTHNNLNGKILGVNCFTSLAVSSSFISPDLNHFPRINSLITSQLQFSIISPHSSSIEFTYTIIYI